ncbi:alpha/beta fold hydrolase [Peredibacter starrii]|uniref:Alpha/beta hydrolase n=1 Tax=Peredibacter starrii TaxID=28202 RepID=A0AAX4HP34_9BACT|nr:alpha/beta hydrolase [Peredibacter starrii]WPU64935.1 alpha/beta hydrolase [Peredibacter starrii]
MNVLIFLILSVGLSMAAFLPQDAELTKFTYPFPVKFHEIRVKKKVYKMAFMDIQPQGEAKGTVVLLHGKNFSGHYWERTAKDLLNNKYRVIIPDQIGFGKSSKPEAFPYSLQFLAKLTHELVTKQKVDKYILVGHSMGGMLATRQALMFPDSIQKLALINPIGLEDWRIKVPYKDVNELYQIELKNDETKIRDYQKNVYYDGQWKPEYEKGIEVLVGWTLHKDFPRIAWNSALTTDMVFTQPVVYEFKYLKVPTLLLIGTRDRTAIGKGWAPDSVKNELGRYDLLGKAVIKDIPNGTLKELPGIGHMPQVETYDQYWKTLSEFIVK